MNVKMTKKKSLGQAAYEHYLEASHRAGDKWEHLPDFVRGAWEATSAQLRRGSPVTENNKYKLFFEHVMERVNEGEHLDELADDVKMLAVELGLCEPAKG
jgi:hypothetical protein